MPLMRMARGKARFLYALMDGGYSSSDIIDFASEHMEAVPVIDFKADRNGAKEEMDPAKRRGTKPEPPSKEPTASSRTASCHQNYSQGERTP